MQLSDTLSRLSSIVQRDDTLLNLHDGHIVFSDMELDQECKETESCLVLSTVYRLTHNEWPTIHRQTPQIDHKYWDMREELTSENCIFLKDCRIITPSALRESALHDLQEHHSAITKCWPIARSIIYWLGIDRAIGDYIKQCP